MDKLGRFYAEHYAAYSDRIEDKKVELVNSAQRLEDWAKKNIDSSMEILVAAERLDCFVTSYFYDILRFKHFHGMLDEGKESRVNFQKIYAYTARWLLREKPLYAVCDDIEDIAKRDQNKAEQYSDFAELVNEIWLLQWIEASYFSQTKERLNLHFYGENLEHGLFYLMKYRDFSTGLFEELLNTKVNHEILEQL